MHIAPRTNRRRPARLAGLGRAPCVAVLAAVLAAFLVALPAAGAPAAGAHAAGAPTARAEPSPPSGRPQVDAATVDSRVHAYAEASGTPSVAAAVVGPDGDVTVHGVGADADTRFRIASMSKAFTATVAMMLVEDEDLDLDEPVVDVLPEFRMPDGRAGDITLRMLLTHTSGLSASEYNDLALPAPDSLTEAVSRLDGTRLAHDPGAVEEYANTNFTIAARMIEVATGQDVDAVLAERLFRPLDMDNTTSTFRCETPVPGLDRGHIPVAGWAIRAPELPGACGGNGGVVSTARDMGTWMAFQLGDGRAASGERLLGEDTLRALHTAQPGAGRQALGWAVSELHGHQRVGHTGALFTYSSAMALLPEQRVAAVVLTDAVGSQVQLVDALLTDQAGDGHDAPFSAPMRTVDRVLAGLAVLSVVGLGVGVARARRWAGTAMSPWRRGAGFVWPVALALIGAAAPLALGLVYAGSLTVQSWLFAAWILPTAVALCLVWLIGGVALTSARCSRVRAGLNQRECA